MLSAAGTIAAGIPRSTLAYQARDGSALKRVAHAGRVSPAPIPHTAA